MHILGLTVVQGREQLESAACTRNQQDMLPDHRRNCANDYRSTFLVFRVSAQEIQHADFVSSKFEDLGFESRLQLWS